MTKKILAISAILLAQQFITFPSHAQKTIKQCESIKAEFKKQLLCLTSIKESVERELQTWVNNHVFNLEDKASKNNNNAPLKMFKRSHDKFITFRQNNCRWQYLAVSPEKGAGIAYKKCYILLTQSRINELDAISYPKS